MSVGCATTQKTRRLRLATLFASLRPCVKLENNNAKTRWRKEQKSPGAFHWNFRLCLGFPCQFSEISNMHGKLVVGTTRLHRFPQDFCVNLV
nr:hypothetical protein GZ11A10_29 [uncultured archaeon GZfos11A10]